MIVASIMSKKLSTAPEKLKKKGRRMTGMRTIERKAMNLSESMVLTVSRSSSRGSVFGT